MDFNKNICLECSKEILYKSQVNDQFDHIYIAQGALFQIGINVKIEPFVSIVCKKEITLGDNVTIAPGVTIVDFDHDITDPARIQVDGVMEAVHIGNNVWIGANAVILKGVTVGKNSIIGAGCVVTHDIPPDEIWVGNPCRLLRKRIYE